MGWQQKFTAFHNSTRHSMDKIVEGFDTDKGQILKIEWGNIKLQMLIDFSFRASLLVYK